MTKKPSPLFEFGIIIAYLFVLVPLTAALFVKSKDITFRFQYLQLATTFLSVAVSLVLIGFIITIFTYPQSKKSIFSFIGLASLAIGGIFSSPLGFAVVLAAAGLEQKKAGKQMPLKRYLLAFGLVGIMIIPPLIKPLYTKTSALQERYLEESYDRSDPQLKHKVSFVEFRAFFVASKQCSDDKSKLGHLVEPDHLMECIQNKTGKTYTPEEVVALSRVITDYRDKNK